MNIHNVGKPYIKALWDSSPPGGQSILSVSRRLVPAGDCLLSIREMKKNGKEQEAEQGGQGELGNEDGDQGVLLCSAPHPSSLLLLAPRVRSLGRAGGGCLQ